MTLFTVILRYTSFARSYNPCRQLSSQVTLTPLEITEKLLKPTTSKEKTFQYLKIHPSVIEALEKINITKPTEIQTLVANPIIKSKHTLIAAETGAGKTIAYLAPLLTRLKPSFHSDTTDSNNTSSTQSWSLKTQEDTISHIPPGLRPSILVLVPTRELSAQVHRVSKALSHVIKYRSRQAPSSLRGSGSKSARVHALRGGADLLVATPGGADLLRKQGKLYFSKLQTLVIDEVDELLANKAGFRPILDPILEIGKKNNIQFVYAGATIPRALEDTLRMTHEKKIEVIRGSALHRVLPPSRVRAVFIRVDGGSDVKLQKARELVMNRRGRQQSGKILIFCDSTKRREELVEYLRDRDVPALHLSAAGKDISDRADDWNRFCNSEEKNAVAVCSKSYGRGIDDTNIDTIIMVDVPMTGAEYVHRIGRIRGQGRVYVLVGQREQALAEALFLRQVRGETLAGVEPKMAWKEYINAGKDRIATDNIIRFARKNKQARWVDERSKALGSFRGKSMRRFVVEDKKPEEGHNWRKRAIKRLRGGWQ